KVSRSERVAQLELDLSPSVAALLIVGKVHAICQQCVGSRRVRYRIPKSLIGMIEDVVELRAEFELLALFAGNVELSAEGHVVVDGSWLKEGIATHIAQSGKNQEVYGVRRNRGECSGSFKGLPVIDHTRGSLYE